MLAAVLLGLCLSTYMVVAPDDGRMPYPLMGFNAWAADPGRPNETAIIGIAEALIKTGLRDAGYVYMDFLIGYARNTTTMQVQLSEPERWTGGSLKFLVGWLHSHGFKFSTGLSPDRTSCTGEVGICGPRPSEARYPSPNHCHAAADAQWFAEQGTDHWPSDYCTSVCWDNATCCSEFYGRIWDAIQATGRNMSFGIYSGSGPCVAHAYTWAPRIGHYWRTGSDMKNVWDGQPGSVMGEVDNLIWNDAQRLAQGPGAYNLLDALVVGAPNRTDGTGTDGTGLTTNEARSHMGLWVALSSPLILSIDVRQPIKPEILSILTNPAVLAVHKDPLARQGRPIPAVFDGRSALKLGEQLSTPTINDPVLVIAKPLTQNHTALLVVNRGSTTQQSIVVAFDDMHTEVNPAPALRQAVADLWGAAGAPSKQASCCLRLPPLAPHSSRFLRLVPQASASEQGACDKYINFTLCALID